MSKSGNGPGRDQSEFPESHRLENEPRQRRVKEAGLRAEPLPSERKTERTNLRLNLKYDLNLGQNPDPDQTQNPKIKDPRNKQKQAKPIKK